jgi:hypothetical protein
MIGDREFQKQSGLSISNAIGYVKFRSRSHDAVIRVYDDAGNVIEMHEHIGDLLFKIRWHQLLQHDRLLGFFEKFPKARVAAQRVPEWVQF